LIFGFTKIIIRLLRISQRYYKDFGMATEKTYEDERIINSNALLTPGQRSVYQLLLNYISGNSLKEGDKLPSFKALADELGVSLKILQKVISIMSMDGVLQTAPYVGTFVSNGKKNAGPPEGPAESPAKNNAADGRRQRRMVALILPWNTPELMDRMQVMFQDAGIGLLTLFTPMPDPATNKMQLLAACSHQVDGIIWFSSQESCDQSVFDLLARVRASGVHVLTVDIDTPRSCRSCDFCFDFHTAFRELAAHLKEQGYRRTACVSIHKTPGERERLFVSTALEAGLADGGRIFRGGGLSEGSLLAAVEKFREPTALFCDNDFVAIETLNCLRLRRQIPGEIGVVSLGDLLLGGKYRIGELVSPSVTALRFHHPLLVENVVVRMIADINLGSEETPDGSVACLPLRLVSRESTRRLKWQRENAEPRNKPLSADETVSAGNPSQPQY
jgi:DNA-binding LacI/PurR family transcriptional regulator